MVSLELLKNADIFENLTDEELAQIQPCCEEVTLGKNTAIFMENDPGEMVNLAGKPEYAALLQQHRKHLAQWCRRTNDSFDRPGA